MIEDQLYAGERRLYIRRIGQREGRSAESTCPVVAVLVAFRDMLPNMSDKFSLYFRCLRSG
jgi:hypothetical protein